MTIPKKLYVVFYTCMKDVAFITEDKSTVKNFFKRPKRRDSYFYEKITDPEHIKLFLRDFPDSYPICEGENVMIDHEYYSMCEAMTTLISDLTNRVSDTVEISQYLQLSDSELHDIMVMCKILYDRFEYDVDFDEQEEIFDEEYIRERYLDELGE